MYIVYSYRLNYSLNVCMTYDDIWINYKLVTVNFADLYTTKFRIYIIYMYSWGEVVSEIQ